VQEQIALEETVPRVFPIDLIVDPVKICLPTYP
jgi:hypothetical protein